MPRWHKQTKWINMAVQFSLCVSSKRHCQAEFLYIENGLLSKNKQASKQTKNRKKLVWEMGLV